MSESRIDAIMAGVEPESTAQPGLVPEAVPLTPEPIQEQAPEPVAEEREPEALEPPKSEVTVETTDDYGTPITKKERVYTEAEVQAMIRDRLSRGQFAQQPQAPDPQPQIQQTQTEPDNWEAQLDSYIDQRLAKKEQIAEQQRWQRQEQENQANFEIRFNQGMAKYQDFEQVVVGKPLTPQMVIATRGMQDPAAFIYAAAKTQAPELERISRIQDPITQVVELGRLEERMRKARSSVSQAPKPIDIVKGDVVDKPPKTWSIDDKLRMTEEASRKERMQGRKI